MTDHDQTTPETGLSATQDAQDGSVEGAATTRYRLDKDEDLWWSTPNGKWMCDAVMRPSDDDELERDYGPTVELMPATPLPPGFVAVGQSDDEDLARECNLLRDRVAELDADFRKASDSADEWCATAERHERRIVELDRQLDAMTRERNQLTEARASLTAELATANAVAQRNREHYDTQTRALVAIAALHCRNGDKPWCVECSDEAAGFLADYPCPTARLVDRPPAPAAIAATRQPSTPPAPATPAESAPPAAASARR